MFKGYQVVKNVVPKNVCQHITNYFLLKRNVTKTLFKSKYIAPTEESYGTLSDGQCECFSIYSDINTEVLLTKLRPLVEKIIGKELIETYSYARVYERGSILKKHVDRPSCEFSTTLNLGGDSWPIFIDNQKVILKPGDMLVYEGARFEHWRERFDGLYCVQTFLHYIDIKNKNLKYDERPMLGLPNFFKGVKYD